MRGAGIFHREWRAQREADAKNRVDDLSLTLGLCFVERKFPAGPHAARRRKINVAQFARVIASFHLKPFKTLVRQNC